MTIKELRKRYNITQKRLAEITGIPYRTLQNWEEGISSPPDYAYPIIIMMIEKEVKTHEGAYPSDEKA